MSACEQMRGLLAGAIEGTLAPAARGPLDDHLRECASCRRVLADQAALKQALGGLGVATVSPGFAARVRERVTSRPWLEVVNWRVWTLRLAPLAALLALLAWLPAPTDTTAEGTLAAAMDTWSTGGGTGETRFEMLLNPEVDAHTLLDAEPEGGAK